MRFKLLLLTLLTFFLSSSTVSSAWAFAGLSTQMPESIHYSQFAQQSNTAPTAQSFDFGSDTSDHAQPPAPDYSNQNAGPLQTLFKGSLLGKLLFNMPFEKASLVDIIALLAAAFVLSRLISRSGLKGKGPFGSQPNFGNGAGKDDGRSSEQGSTGGPAAPPPGFDPWARFRSNQSTPQKGKTIPFPGAKESPSDQPQSAQSQIQPDFNSKEDEFLKGAKTLYVRLHEAWKNQDLDFIQHFSSPQVFSIYEARSQGPEKNDFMDIVKVDAQVLKEENKNGERYIVVEFSALAHQSKQAGPPHEVKETWAFLEPTNTGTWRLEEIL